MKYLYLPQSNGPAVLFTVIGSPWGFLGLYLLFINVITFFVFGVDKWKAKRKVTDERVRRIPEKRLFLLAAAGGSVGAILGMRTFRHKTLHKTFRFGLPAILFLQLTLAAGLFVYATFIR